MYIVSGATGQTGSVVARTLLDKGLPVRVIVRSEDKGKAWQERGAEIAVADVQNAVGLKEALKGGKALYLVNPLNYQSDDLFVETEKVIAAFRTAIENSQIEKLVVLSGISAHLSTGTGVVGTLHRLEQAFKDPGIRTTFVRPPSFMENWNSTLETVKKEGILPSFFQPLDKKVPHISVEDVGREAAIAMLENWDGLRIVELAGIEYSPIEVAEAFSRVLGKDVQPIAIPENQWLDIFSTFCSPRNAELMVELERGINSGHLTFETEDQRSCSVTIEDYAKKVFS